MDSSGGSPLPLSGDKSSCLSVTGFTSLSHAMQHPPSSRPCLSQSIYHRYGRQDPILCPFLEVLCSCSHARQRLHALIEWNFVQENSGNDPNTQIVPAGSGSSWQKVDETPAGSAADPKALIAGSTWATSKDTWQPPAPASSTLPPPRPGSRRLNPHEYPSLAAAASGRGSLPKQRLPTVPDTQVRPGVATATEQYCLILSKARPCSVLRCGSDMGEP